jgi:hypothetical protein
MGAHNLEKQRTKRNIDIGNNTTTSKRQLQGRQFRDFQQTSKLFMEDLDVARRGCAKEVDT